MTYPPELDQIAPGAAGPSLSSVGVTAATKSSTTDAVDTRSLAYLTMAAHWELIDDLCGGTAAMQASGTKWLPQFEGELPKNYAVRLRGSFLYEAFKDTLKKLSAKPFAKPLTIEGELPEKLAGIDEDCDRRGTSLDAFAFNSFKMGIRYGLVHAIVDYPRVDPDPKVTNREVERALGVRPYFVFVNPKNLIGWKEETDSQGSSRLVEIRILEQSVEPVGNYSETLVERVRVWTPTEWRVEKKDPKAKQFTVESTGVNTLGRIPLETCLFEPTGTMTAEPPLEGLAWKNLEHYQSSSDQRNCLRVARFNMPYAFGLSDDEQRAFQAIGPNTKVSSSNENAKAGFIHGSAEPINAGKEDLLLIEDQMTAMGLAPMLEKQAGATATGRAIDAGATESQIQTWIRQLEDWLERLLSTAGDWVKTPVDVEISIFDDFGIGLAKAADITALIAMRTAGEISRETFLAEMKRRGLLSDMVDVQQEMDRISAEGPSLAEMTRPPSLAQGVSQPRPGGAATEAHGAGPPAAPEAAPKSAAA